jgi:hypothetical protein
VIELAQDYWLATVKTVPYKHLPTVILRCWFESRDMPAICSFSIIRFNTYWQVIENCFTNKTTTPFQSTPRHIPVFYSNHRDCLSIKSFIFNTQQPPCHSHRTEALQHHPGVVAATSKSQWVTAGLLESL